jgi:hypothetical protein
MRTWVVVLAVGAALACVGDAAAAGSFRPDVELAPVLDQAPAIRDFVAGALDMAESGSGDRIGNAANTLLGGTRVGPYVIEAKLKGQDGPFDLTLVFHTTCRFLDASGAEVALADAVSVEERFDFLEIRAAQPAPPDTTTAP